MTNRLLDNIFHNFTLPELFMADRGKHFKNQKTAFDCRIKASKVGVVGFQTGHHVRHLQGFTPREGTMLVMEQKKFEEALTTEESNGMEAQASGDELQATIAEEDQEEQELEGSDDNEAGGGMGFFYDNEDKDVQEEEMGIGARVAARRRRHLYSGGGQIE